MCDQEKGIHTFVFTRLVYCNSLYVGINKSLLNRLQLVQNAAARLLTGTHKRDHITPILSFFTMANDPLQNQLSFLFIFCL